MADVDITSLSVEISAESQGAELNIDKLATAISNLRTKGSVGKVCTSLDKLSSSISALKQASAGISGLDKVTNFLNGISSVNTTAGVKGVNSVVNAIKKIPSAVSALNGVDFYSMSGSITQLTNALAPMSILDASSLKALGSAFNAIGKVPDLTDKLKATDLDSFASSCQKISTALTPLASQLDKVGNAFAKLFNFDDKDTRIMIMCGMSACFSALFGTPVAAAVFSMEVISVGIMYYAALVPCTVAALIASSISSMSGLAATHFTVGQIPQLGIPNGIKFFILSLIFAVASILLCVVLHKTSHFFTAHFENQYVRIIVAAVLVIIMRFLFGTTDYLGAGTDIIARSFVEQSAWYVFLLKMIFTAVTLGGGFKGGEIVPTLFVGATLGSFLAPIFGLPTGICAACGMVAVFCGVTNCPLTSLLLSIEMFGSESLKYCLLCIALIYLF